MCQHSIFLFLNFQQKSPHKFNKLLHLKYLFSDLKLNQSYKFYLQNIVMDQNEKYEYNFEYSLANYNCVQEQQQQNQGQYHSQDQQLILRRSNELINFRCFIDKDIQQSIMTIFTHFIQFYGRVSVRLFRICQKIYRSMQMTSSSFIRNHQEAIDSERQKLVENLSQFSQVFYDQKQKYYKLISLCISSSVFKILTLERQIYDLQFETVFHTVFWQITGTHSTSQMLKKLLNQTFNLLNFHNYLINEAPTKVYQMKPLNQSLIVNQKQVISSYSFNSLTNSVRNDNLKLRCLDSKRNDQLAFSKTIKRKEKFNKQNCGSILNQVPQNQQNVYKEKVRFTQNTMKSNSSKMQQSILNKQKNQQEIQSVQKPFNFKKDRVNIFFNYSKSKSNKKYINDINSESKKPTFANYLQQKKLYF